MIVDGDGDGDVNGLFDPRRPRETVAVAVAVNDQVNVNVYGTALYGPKTSMALPFIASGASSAA